MLIQGRDEVRPEPAAALAGPPAVAPGDPAGPASHRERVPDVITMVGGLVCAAEGVAVMVSWFVRATAVLRFGSQSPMTFNTALALAVTGAALVALARRRPGAALAAGVFNVVLGAVVLAEYGFGRGLGIDQLIVKAYINGPHDVPGRMAVNSAACLALAGAGLLASGPWRPRPRPAVLAAAGCVIAAIAVIAAFGNAVGNPAAYGWGHATVMPFPTASAMLVLAVSLLSAAWREDGTRQEGLPRWLPMPAGVLALGLAAGVWLAAAGRGEAPERVYAGTVTGSATVLGLVMVGLVVLVVLVVWQADRRRRAAREGERLLFRFLDVLPAAVFISSADGRPYYANGEAKRVLGRGAAPGIGAGELAEVYGAFLAGTDQPYPIEKMAIARGIRGQTSHIDDMEIHRPDGSVFPLEVWGCPVYGAGGEVEYAINAFADMSERSARERTISGQAELLDLAHDAIFVRDPDGQITYWNAGAEDTYGFTRAEAVGRISDDLLRTQFPEPLAAIEATVARCGRWDGELIHRCADGRAITVESRWAAQRGPGGPLLGFLEINRDITARKDAEQRVQQRTVHLERANKNLAAFTYSAAHDLRTPLRGISGFAEALAEDYGGRLDETGREYTGRIQAAAEHMAAVLDDLVHLSQVSSAGMSLQDIDLSAEVTAICNQLRTRDPGRRVQVTVQDGVRVTADRPLIRTALEELLENAWKFTAGREHATIEFATMPAADAPVCCYVRDNGAGFDSAYGGKLFTPFQRLHAAAEFPGTGTGLAIVQRIIDRHCGRTWAEGTIDHGATIYFTLDAKDTQ